MMPTAVADHSSSSSLTQRMGDSGTSAYTTSSGTTLANGGSSYVSRVGTYDGRRGSDASEEQSFPDQFENLHNELKIANAIKEGAENMLQIDTLTDTLRMQVESELKAAKDKISALTSTIETYSKTGRKPGNEQTAVNGKARSNRPPPMHVKYNTEAAEDFRSAMQQANSCMRTLLSSYHAASAAQSPLGASPSTSPSTSAMPNVAAANSADLERARVEAMTRLVTVLQRNLRVRYELDVEEVVKAVLPSLSDRSSKGSRATAYRLIRHSLVDFHSVERLKEQKLDWFLVKSLSRDSKYAVEKEQVIKLIRAIVEIGSERRRPGAANACASGAVPLSSAVMRSVIAVAESADDPFRPICLQTLTEILLIDIELMGKTGGIRVLLHALAEGTPEMTPLLASAFLHIVDCPSTRVYLKPGIDLEMALSGVTDAYGKGSEYVDRMRACARVVTSMLRTWSGLMYFCIQDKLAIRSLIDGLRIPLLETREVILDMFFDLLNIRAPDWHQAFIAGRRLTIYRKPASESKELPPLPEPVQRPPMTMRLIDHFLALLIQVLCGAGLLDALTCMLEESPVGSNLSRKAVLLMAEILQMSNRVLPLSIAARIQALPRVFNLASDYAVGEHRIIGNSALSSIDSFNRHQARVQPAPIADKCDTRPRANSVEDAVRRGQRQVREDKMKQALQMDDKTFQAILLDSQVMTAKDPSKWNFEVLQELIEGPLLNSKRMEEAIRVSRYMRKLMSFFHPFSHKFSDMPKTKANIRWVRLGCQLLTALLQSSEGAKFLAEDDLLNQIVRSFAQLDPFNGAQTSDPIFSKKRMNETLTFGYFEMLGTLSKRKEGLVLLEKFKLFTAFYHLTELRSREDLLKGTIENLDYSHDGHSRIVLSKALTSSYKHIRLFATNHLGSLIRASATTNAWTLRLLLTQLYDPAFEVREVAVRFLEEACESTDVLQSVVEMQPTLDHLGEMGHPLMLKFMSTPMGFRFLYAANYIDREMDIWFHERNLQYVVYIEVFLAKIFSSNADDDEDALTLESMVPPHFYGVMAKTELGYQVLQEKGHFAEFSDFIRQHGLESVDHDLIMKLKSVLWAVGNIGATEGGLTLLEDEEIIPEIIKIAEESLVLSVRGTCFFVLGLIGSTPQGAEILDDYHWEATLSPLGMPTGICVPVDVEKFTYIPPWECIANESADDVRLEPPKSDEETEVMTAIYNLANTVIANTASRSLAKMKTRPEYRHIFSSPEMYFRALHTISSQKYRMPVRRYILDLFDVELDATMVARLSEYANTLQMKPAQKPVKPSLMRVVSIVGRPNPEHRASDSEDDGSDDDDRAAVVEKPPVMSLRPVSRIVGFEGNSYFD